VRVNNGSSFDDTFVEVKHEAAHESDVGMSYAPPTDLHQEIRTESHNLRGNENKDIGGEYPEQWRIIKGKLPEALVEDCQPLAPPSRPPGVVVARRFFCDGNDDGSNSLLWQRHQQIVNSRRIGLLGIDDNIGFPWLRIPADAKTTLVMRLGACRQRQTINAIFNRS
jgi:hypothetical protein